jgi:hypothetical protein
MIEIKARKHTIGEKEFSIIPEGVYTVVVEEILPWKEIVKPSELINVRDLDGKLVRDSNGKVEKETIKDYKFNTCDVAFRITEGEFANRVIYGNLTTHDNALFITENFLYAVKVNELKDLNDIYNKGIVGTKLQVQTMNKPYTKEVKNQNTGVNETIETAKTKIKTYLRMPIKD